jgi:hypothetical protein
MGQFVYPFRTKTPELISIHARILGVGAGAPTKEFGEGVTFTRDGVGLYTVTFAENNGKFMGAEGAFFVNTLAASTARVVQFDFDSYTGSSPYALAFAVHDVATPTVAELAAAQRIWLSFYFRRTGVTG